MRLGCPTLPICVYSDYMLGHFHIVLLEAPIGHIHNTIILLILHGLHSYICRVYRRGSSAALDDSEVVDLIAVEDLQYAFEAFGDVDRVGFGVLPK
jgi:hypothetical protein